MVDSQILAIIFLGVALVGFEYESTSKGPELPAPAEQLLD